MKPAKPNLIVLGRYFTWEREDVKEGISHRHYGLYTNLSKLFLESNQTVFWYSFEERTLRRITGSPNEPSIDRKQTNPISAIFNSVKTCLDKAASPAIILNYPHTLLGFERFPEYVLMLASLHLLKSGMDIPVYIDNIDPPIEHQQYLGEEDIKTFFKKFLWYFLEPMVMKGYQTIVTTESWKEYYVEKINVSPQNISIIPCGSFPEIFSFDEKFSREKKLAVFYAGTASKKSNVDKLAEVVTELAEEGADIQLTIAGKDLIGLEADSIEILYPLSFRGYAENLVKADVAIVTYTGRYPSFTSIAKVGDYLMAGTPIISLPLYETGKVIEEGECGYIVQSFRELKQLFKQLWKDRSTLSKLSRKARVYAEKHMNYQEHARKLFEKIRSLVEKQRRN